MCSRFEPLDNGSFQIIQRALVSYIQSEYVRGSMEAEATCELLGPIPRIQRNTNVYAISDLRNKFSHTLTLFFLCTYSEQWPSFFADFLTLLRTENGSFNHHISLFFFHIVLEISGEVADQIIKSARSFNQMRHIRDARVRDLVRERDAGRINEAVLTIVADAVESNKALRKRPTTPEVIREINSKVEIIDWGVRTFGSYVSECLLPLVLDLLLTPDQAGLTST